MKTKITIILTLIIAFLLFSQEDYICWEKTYGNEVNDMALSVIQLSNGNYAVAGYYGIMLSDDYYTAYCQLNYLDPLGNLIWELWHVDEVRGSAFIDIVESTDSCIIALKNTMLSANSGYQYGVELFKIDLEGTILWSKLYTHKYSVRGNAITTTADGGFAVCGRTELTDSTEAGIVMKFDSNCDSLWTTEVENTGYYKELYSITSDYNCNIYSVGHTYYGWGSDSWIVKLDSTGTILYNIDAGGSTVGDSYYAVSYTDTDNSFIAVGEKGASTKYGSEILVSKYNPDCEPIWEKRYHIDPSSWDEPNSVTTTADGGCVITGTTNDHTFIMKADAQGDTLWTRIYKSTPWMGYEQHSDGMDIKETTDGGLLFCGSVFRGNLDKDWDMWVMKLDPEGLITDIGEDENHIVSDYELYQNYPNPFNNETKIQYLLSNDSKANLCIYNTKGELVKEIINSKQLKGTHSVSFQADNLNSGIYYYQLKINGIVRDTKRMVYLK